jgi:hypothetical protein
LLFLPWWLVLAATIDAARPNRERAFSHARYAIAWNMAARLKCCLNGAANIPLSFPRESGESSTPRRLGESLTALEY